MCIYVQETLTRLYNTDCRQLTANFKFLTSSKSFVALKLYQSRIHLVLSRI